MKSIILIGYMGAGKTTVGRNLAKRLGRMFYDLDWYIADRFHKRIPQLFEEKGEEGFRKMERGMLQEVAAFEDIVLACGGGTPCFFDNMDYMNSCGITVYMNASVHTIINHLQLSHTVRPLLRDKSGAELEAYITEQLEERRSFYEQAQVTFDVDVLDDFSKINGLVSRMAVELEPIIRQEETV